MRRILLVLTVAAIMAALMVSAGPAQAQTNISSGSTEDIENSFVVVQSNDDFTVVFDDEVFDFGFDEDFGGVGVSIV